MTYIQINEEIVNLQKFYFSGNMEVRSYEKKLEELMTLRSQTSKPRTRR